MTVSYLIVNFGEHSPPPIQDITDLHEQLLPRSPIAKLGRPFMERFYYSILPRAGQIFGSIAYVDDSPAGFITATHDSAGFMKSMLLRQWPRLVWVISMSLIQTPHHAGSVWEAFRLMTTRNKARGAGLEGEILSLGVLTAFVEPGFVRRTGLRIAYDLIDSVMSKFGELGTPLIRAVVDADNTSAKFFYHSLGWTLYPDHVPGWRTPTVEFVWRPEQNHI